MTKPISYIVNRGSGQPQSSVVSDYLRAVKEMKGNPVGFGGVEAVLEPHPVCNITARSLSNRVSRANIPGIIEVTLYDKADNMIVNSSFNSVMKAYKLVSWRKYAYGKMCAYGNGTCYFYNEEEWREALASCLSKWVGDIKMSKAER